MQDDRVWLEIAANEPVPYGPVRFAAPGSSDPKLDGNPFTLFYRSASGESGHLKLAGTEAEVTVLGRVLKLLWFDAIVPPGKLLLVYGLLNCGDHPSVVHRIGEPPLVPAAYVYCFGWNRMCVAHGGMLHVDTCHQFGLPESMAYPPLPKKV